ncbi:MAG: sigma 54-interacting transcriptional regulator [Planctomycetota bacterium]
MSAGPPPLEPQVLEALVAGTVTATGEGFFAELVRQLARALSTMGAWVTEWLPESRRLRALSFWLRDGYYGDYEYDVGGTPCEPVVDELRLIHVPERLLELFAGDPDIRELGAASYLGVPLLDTDGGLLGHLAVLHDAPLPQDPRIVGVFEVFAGRAAAELRRLRRERDLAEREEQLSSLFAGAMDAILELDPELRVTRANPAAAQAFGVEPAELLGAPLAARLTQESQGRLVYLAQELGRRPEGQQALWVPSGLEAVRGDGRRFPAEATLSRFGARGQARYALILRDVDARHAAEARIQELLAETASLRSELDSIHGFREVLGASEALARVLGDVERVAESETTVLVLGETGTGKELVARAIHERSPRAGRPLVTVNCAAIPAGLQESEFFGHEKGAFTGATQRREGRLRMAHEGTIFLDEVGELPLDLQAKLLRVLQEGELQPVGSSRTETVDVRANPVEYLLHAMAGCVTTTLALHAAARGIALRSLRSELEGEIDLQGLLGLDDEVPVGYREVRIKLFVDADCSQEELDDLLRFAETHSPVCRTVCRPVPVKLSWSSPA